MSDWFTRGYEVQLLAEGDRIRAKHPALATVDFGCHSGWYAIIETYLDEVARLLAAHPGSTYEARQFKEKLGGLRLYARASDDIRDGVDAAERTAEQAADRTCEVCGGPGRLLNISGLYATRCDKHAEGGKPMRWQEPTELEVPGLDARIRVHIPDADHDDD